MMRTGLLVAIALTALAGDAAGQFPVPVGARVRMRVDEEQRQLESRYRRGLVLRGEITAVTGDTVFLRPAPQTGVLPIPIANVKWLYRSRGVQSRLVSGLTGTIVGAIVGLLYVELLALDDTDGFGLGGASQHDRVVGTVVGGVVSGVIGLAFPVERWRRVHLD